MANYKRCVIIDDSKADLFIAKLIIQKCQLDSETVELTNGEEALTWFNNNLDITDTLVLLDINMPIMGGFELLEALKDTTFAPSVHVYLLSSSTHPDDKNRAKNYPIVKSYLVKPMKRALLMSLFK